jgi:hypothetical protein
MNWPRRRFGLASPFKMMIEAHRTVTQGRGTRRTSWSSRSGKSPTSCRRRARPGPPSLSFAYKKGQRQPKLPFPSHFFLNAEMRTPLRSLLASRHWAIPRAWLIYTSLHFFCPRFRHHRGTPLSATVDHAGDFQRHR